MTQNSPSSAPAFRDGAGRWAGIAEVYGGDGRFIGHASEQRHVQTVGENRTRIDLNFTGVLSLSGHYFIDTYKHHRLYQGPANVGYAEALSEGLVTANNYWSQWGLSQRFFLFVTPDKQKQMSLALLSRGEQLMYSIIGEHHLQQGEASPTPSLIPAGLLPEGTPYDRRDDPTNGRGEILLHRAGNWSGMVTLLGDDEGELITTNTNHYRESVHHTSEGLLNIDVFREHLPDHSLTLYSNGWQAWTPAGDVVGSCNLIGGRALSGHFHHLADGTRVWRREVVSVDGTHKVIVHVWYSGGARFAVQFGLLTFEAEQA